MPTKTEKKNTEKEMNEILIRVSISIIFIGKKFNSSCRIKYKKAVFIINFFKFFMLCAVLKKKKAES